MAADRPEGRQSARLKPSVVICGNHDTRQVSSVCFSWSGTLGWETALISKRTQAPVLAPQRQADHRRRPS